MEECAKLASRKRLAHGSHITVEDDIISSTTRGSSILVKFLEPLNPLLNYFEYVIENVGPKTAIGIGVGEKDYPMHRMPGWDANSCGYHADDGRLFCELQQGADFGTPCTKGDRMGCGVDFSTTGGTVNVFFTKNGQLVGYPVPMRRPVAGLYPLIGLHSGGESVRYLGHRKMDPNSATPPMETDGTLVWLRSNGIRFDDDGLTLAYEANGVEAMDVGIAQSRYCLDACNHYFEIEILSAGERGAVAIGVGDPTYPLHAHPGWEGNSLGYHADDGKLFKGCGQGNPFGPTCTTGDRMGCGLKFAADSAAGEEAFIGEDGTTGLKQDQGSESSSDSDGAEDLVGGAEMLGGVRLFERIMEEARMARLHRRYSPLRRRLKARQVSITRKASSTGRMCTVYFTKNGEVVGETKMEVPKRGLYPLVAMLSKGERSISNKK